MLGEEGFVRGVDGGEVVQVFHEHGGFHDVGNDQAGGLADRIT